MSSKRRKLDHDNNQTMFESKSSLQNDGEVNPESASSEESEENSPNAQSGQPALKPKRTHEDDHGAIYAGGMYKSSMFKLQVDEMLAEVRPNYEKRVGVIDDTLRRLKGLVEGIEGREALSILEATRMLHKSHKITIPFPNPKPDTNAAYKLAYERPSNINVVGSYALKTMVKSDDVFAVDMVVKMPDTLFQEKDFLNYRYFYKRAYYLACITAGLQEYVQDEFTLNFAYLNGNCLHTILVVKPKSKGKSKSDPSFEVHIILAAPEKFFAESKLRPTKSSIRLKGLLEGKTTTPAPSPFYNASLKSDCNVELYLKVLNSASKQSTGFKDSCILGRIWLHQRGFGSCISKGGFGHFEWAALTALLLRGGGPKGHSVLSPGYSSYQMFKAVLQFLSSNDLASTPMVYESPDFVLSKSDTPMFYDGPRGQNVLYKMTPWSYKLLREESKTSLDMLNDATFDQFESAFILRTDQPLQQYDCAIRVPIPSQIPEVFSGDHKPDTFSFSNHVYEVLQEGLMDRVKLIDIKGTDMPSWSIKSSGPSLPDEQILFIAVVFDPLNIDRLVDHGPPAEDKTKAAKFQKFWGEKAELRRFKDGSILESLVWSSGSAYSIFQDIVTYLMKRHFAPETSKSLTFFGEGFERFLPGSEISSKAFEALKQAFDTFEKSIRDLEGLPLQLKQLSVTSPQLRYSSIHPPTFNPRKPLKVPADVLIQFEGSGRWPDDIVAIQRTKIAFLLKIGSLLQESNDSITTHLGIENESQSFQNCAFLDIIYPSGASFRLRIHNDREQTLLERQIKDKSTDHRSREDAVAALSIYKRIFTQLPLHTQSVTTHCTRFPLLSPSIRLTKMWFDRHMLSGHISEELIELLVIRIFLQPYPWRAPSSAMTGFLRTLLFISRWDWRLVPLIVDFTGTMTSKEVASISTRLEAWRKIDPGMNRTVLFAASNHDTTGTAFTYQGPSRMVAARMTALARSACKLVKDQGLDLDHRSLFAASTADYDFVIHLSSKFDDDHVRKGPKHKFKNFEVQSEIVLDTVGYEPVREYIHELEKLYTNSVVFFHSATSGSVITGLWNPQIVAPRAFKVSLAYATEPETRSDGDEGTIKLDKSAILSEIARIGGNMVSRVEVRQ